MQIARSRQAAGAASQLLYVRASITRFAEIYSSKGRWSLLDGALLVPQTCPDDICGQNSSRSAEAHEIAKCPNLANKRCVAGLSLQEVEREVNTALTSVLGVGIEGKQFVCFVNK